MTPWTVAYQAPPSRGFSRQECWSGLPFPSPGDLPDPEIKHGSPTSQADTLPSEPPGKPCKQEAGHKYQGRGKCRRPRFDLWVGKIPWRRKWQPTPAFLPGKSHGQRSLAGYGPWGCKSYNDFVTKPPPPLVSEHTKKLVISGMYRTFLCMGNITSA